MKFRKALNGLIITLLTMVISACSSNKNIRNDQSSAEMLSRRDEMDINDKDNFSSREEMPLQIENLKQNNVVYFDLDKYNIRSDCARTLDSHASFLRQYPSYKITVEGHADERGTPEYNISLGERRASAVKSYLQNLGVSTDQVSIISYGKEKPAVPYHNEEAYAKNRRAVLLY